VYEFGVGIGGSAVPKHGGPSVGLAKKPDFVWSTTVDKVADTLGEEISDNQLGMEVEDEALDKDPEDQHPKKAHVKMPHRPRRVRWLKPIERVLMLRKAGISEKKIYRMLMESSDIAMSRRISLSDKRAPIRCRSH
jgi:hypothetical protein